ncbi:MAG: type I DNA topoisomerase [Actinobacteria bacterium]|nr:type I DNA topoisomerase [Actinomycetota bacterium]
MAKPLVIVESPAKARTIAKILGKDFVVESSIGHIRDLPATAAEIPAAYKGEDWARLGVDIENDFKPLYVVPRNKKQQVTKLKGLLKAASEVYVATDEDREGESIAWHLVEVLSPSVPVKRMVFHEITSLAVEHAVENPRELDRRLVDAQEGRRILDRLYGYEVSPVLWKKVLPRLSAGRVQSVATRIIVQRERERMRFRSASYWDLDAVLAAPDGDGAPTRFTARLVSLDGSRLATGKDFDASGQLSREAVVLNEQEARALAQALRAADFAVSKVEEKPYKSSPYPPFITSTLQQEAGRKLNFSAQRTMQTAQRLYENGFITYMRTDNVGLSETALRAARATATRLYGTQFVPDAPRRYQRKVKNAQEAHEAIRPAGDDFRMPESVARQVSSDEARLYELIWKRTVASQMADARGQSVSVRLNATAADAPSTPAGGREAEFAASGKVITFPGYMRAYVEGADDPEAELEDREVRLPPLSVGQSVDVVDIDGADHATQPPARFTEASLVKRLEELGVGRPSTYASILGTIQDRGYVWKKGSALIPSWTAFAVVGLLEKHFSKLVDYDFTAAMEDDLDEIARGEEEAVPWLRRFYYGNGEVGLHALVTTHVDEIDPREINSIPLGKDGDDREVVVRVGRYGPYLQRGEETVSIAEDIAPDELSVEKAVELLEAPSSDRVLGKDPESGLEVHVKAGRYGPYVQLGEMEEGAKEKPRTSSLFQDMDPATVTLEDALRLLSLPRVVGTDPEDGEEITALNGRFGPYLKKGKDTRSLDMESQIFSVTLDEALALFAQPKKGRRRAQAAAIKEFGADPATQAPMVLKEGRYGPYVTDGETNASLPRGESPADLTPERAADLLAEKRAKGRRKKSTRKKTTRKKTTRRKK